MLRINLFKTKLNPLYFLALLLGFQFSFTLYISPNYFQRVTGFEHIEWIFVSTYAISLWLLWKFPGFIKRFGSVQSTFVFLSVRALALLGASLFWRNYLGLALIVVAFATQVLIVAGIDLLIESYSKDRVTGKIRGKVLSLLNLGFLPAPFLAGLLVDRISFGVVFFLASLVVFAMAAILASRFSKYDAEPKATRTRSGNLPKRGKKLLWKKLLARPDILKIYFMAFLLQVFYAATVIYVPLLLLKNGFSWEVIGVILMIMLLPFVFVQYPAGILCDKKGERELLIFALLLMIFSVASLGFINLSHFWSVVLVLVVGRTGAALFEVGRDAYFYKKINALDTGLIGFFRSAQPAAFLAVTLVFGLLSVFLEISSLLILLAIILLVGLLVLFKIKDTR